MAFDALMRKALLVGVCAGFAWSVPVLAQTAPPTEADLDRAFQKVLADPSDLDAAFEYAGIASAMGDYEAAISSLERMLIYNPDLPRVHAELGVLYFRLKSYGAAKSYFQQALAAPDVPDSVRERVNGYLKEINRAKAKNRFAYSITGGVRYQSNANSSPGATVLFSDIPVQLDSQFRKESDVNIFASGTFRHQYDFGGQNGDYLETNINTYLTRQFTVDNLDYIFFQGNSGPVLHLGPESGITLRPYLTASYLMLSESPYQQTLGGGARLGIPLNDRISLGLETSGRYLDYRSSGDRPTADELDSHELFTSADLTFLALPNVQLTGGAQARFINAREDFQTYQEVGFSFGATVSFAAPVNLADGKSRWTFVLDTQGLVRDYDAPNTIVSAETREETEVRANAQVYAPVSANVSLFSGVGWRNISANIPNYEFENFTVMGGVSARF
ncbi:MAG: DUF560 domain-containing protein [Alphaproteobacteria bacterium]|nr:DUF560 domain-containing protein [Alphaproteobacteria bacterium]